MRLGTSEVKLDHTGGETFDEQNTDIFRCYQFDFNYPESLLLTRLLSVSFIEKAKD